jgi:hypothetical protein
LQDRLGVFSLSSKNPLFLNRATNFKNEIMKTKEKTTKLDEYISNQDSFLKVDKSLIILYKPDVALVLANLIDYNKFMNTSGKIKDGWFYCTHENQLDHINISERILRKCKEILKKDGVLLTKGFGTPYKEWYFIDYKILMKKMYLANPLKSNPNETVTLNPIMKVTLNPNEKVTLNPNETVTLNNKEQNKKQTNKESYYKPEKGLDGIEPYMFEKFWRVYPKQTDKGKALTSWNKLCTKNTRPTWKEIKKAILSQIKTERWSDPQFIPAPSNWLDKSRWLDDSALMIKTQFRFDNKNTSRAGFKSQTYKYKEATEI